MLIKFSHTQTRFAFSATAKVLSLLNEPVPCDKDALIFTMQVGGRDPPNPHKLTFPLSLFPPCFPQNFKHFALLHHELTLMANMQPNICPACSCKTDKCGCRLALHTDGNDKLKCRHDGVQRPFTTYAGGDVFVDDKLTAAFEVATHKARSSHNACGASFRVAQGQENSGAGGGAAVKGVVCGVCPHLLVLAAVPMAKGEKYHLHMTALFKALADHTSSNLSTERGIFHMCDISCSLSPWFSKAVKAMMGAQHFQRIVPALRDRPEFAGWDDQQVEQFLADISIWLNELSRTRHGTSQLHSHAHSWDCHVRTAVRNQWQAGLLTGEEAEQVFSFLSAHSKFLRTMRPQSWRHVLSLLISAWNGNMTLRLARRLKGKFLRAVRDSAAQEAAVIDLAGKLQTKGVNLQCNSLADIASVVQEGGMVRTWMKDFYARAVELQANRRHRCQALQKLLMRAMLMVEDAQGDAEPLPSLAEVANMSTAELHLVGATAMKKPVTDTLDRLATVPESSAGRAELLACAEEDLRRFHSDQITLPTYEDIEDIADEIVTASKEVLAQRLLKSTLQEMFSLSALIERLQRDLQINSGSTSQQRRLNTALKRHYERICQQLATYSSVVHLVLPASSGSSIAQETIDAMSPIPSSDSVHAVILRLQHHFQWSSDALSALNAEQFRLAQEITAQATLYFRCREELRLVRKDFQHAAAYYDDLLTTVSGQWASLTDYLEDHWAPDGSTTCDDLLTGAEVILASTRFAVPARGFGNDNTILSWPALRAYTLGVVAHLADAGRQLWARRATLKRAVDDIVSATADLDDPACHISRAAADAMFPDLDLRGLDVGEALAEPLVEEEDDNEAVSEVESNDEVADEE
jgi:hypothetical protein